MSERGEGKRHRRKGSGVYKTKKRKGGGWEQLVVVALNLPPVSRRCHTKLEKSYRSK